MVVWFRHLFTASEHPSADGRIERAFQRVLAILRAKTLGVEETLEYRLVKSFVSAMRRGAISGKHRGQPRQRRNDGGRGVIRVLYI